MGKMKIFLTSKRRMWQKANNGVKRKTKNIKAMKKWKIEKLKILLILPKFIIDSTKFVGGLSAHFPPFLCW